MSLLNKYSTPADRMRKCMFAEQFAGGATELFKNGGSLSGSFTWMSNGLKINNTTSYVNYGSRNALFNYNWTTYAGVVEFTPEFLPNDGAIHYIVSSSANLYGVYKNSDDSLRCIVGGSNVLICAYADYIAYWKVGAVNRIAWSCVTGSNYLYLNGTQIKTSAIAWSAAALSVLSIGQSTNSFVGTVHSLKLYLPLTTTQALTAKDCEVLSLGTTYNYWDSGVNCIMDGLAANYDPVNYRHLDLSGKGNHVLLGNGAGTGTPTKLSTQGYSFAGSQYMTVPLAAWPGSAGTFLLDVCANTNSGTLRLWGTDHTGGANYEVISSVSGTNNRVIMGNGAGQTACNVGLDKRWSKIIVGVTWLSGSFVRGYTDGLFAMSSAINANTPYTPDTAWWLFKWDVSSPGILRSFVAFNRELSSLQIADVTLWMKKLRNRV